ncbi:MAG: hypothetical protein N2035_09385 [Chthoniobacterales bacterium]|nr:hypothetical protein [Chthoniobacterales bacterium]
MKNKNNKDLLIFSRSSLLPNQPNIAENHRSKNNYTIKHAA